MFSFYSCGKKENGDSSTTKVEPIEVPSNEYTKEEILFSEKLFECKEKWELEIKKIKAEELRLVGIGIVGKNCLKMTNVNTLIKVKNAYESDIKNWKSLSRDILKLEKNL